MLTRIIFAFLVILFLVGGPERLLLTATAVQGGSIRGKVVADVPDQRRILTGVMVTLSGVRLGERKLQSVTDREGQFDFQGLVAGDRV